MRKLVTRTFLGLLAVLMLASQASASPIAIGWLTWTAEGQGGTFSVEDQTGVNWLGDPVFPVVTQLLFNTDLNLNVDSTDYDVDTVGTPRNGNSWDIPFIGGPKVATLTGTVSPLLGVLLDLDGIGPGGTTIWNITGTGAITDALGNPIVLGVPGAVLEDGALAVIYVDAERVDTAVPEPATLMLFGTGIVGLIARRRILAKG